MPWALLGQSVTGTSHRSREIPCQDAYRLRRFGPAEERLVVAVADGAGSASHSDLGAVRACEEFVQRVEALGHALRIGSVERHLGLPPEDELPQWQVAFARCCRGAFEQDVLEACARDFRSRYIN